jgi:hypothetical protein
VRIHFAREHALEFHARNLAFEAGHVGFDRADGAFVGLGFRQVEEFRGLGDPDVQAIERTDDRLELGALAAEFLGTLRLAPDRGILEFAQDLRQSLALALVVKDTP